MAGNPYQRPPVRSQTPSRLEPYAPMGPTDLSGTSDLQRPHPPGFPAMGSYVVSTFGTLPPNGIDFYREFGGFAQRPQQVIAGDFELPPGRRLLLRYLVISVVFAFNEFIPTLGAINEFGMPVEFEGFPSGVFQFFAEDNVPLQYSITVDNAAIADHGSIPLFGPLAQPRIIPVHHIIEEGSNLGLSVVYGNVSEGTDPPPDFYVTGAFMGNHLLNRGEALPMAPTNNYALPVQEGTMNNL